MQKHTILGETSYIHFYKPHLQEDVPTEEDLGDKYWVEDEYVCDHCDLRTQSTVLMMVRLTYYMYIYYSFCLPKCINLQYKTVKYSLFVF